MTRDLKFQVYIKISFAPMEEGIMYEVAKINFSPYQISTVAPLAEKFLRAKCLDFFLRQYTGLKDKNGNEIYEGDILAYYVIGFPNDKIRLSTVKFEDGAFVIDEDRLTNKCGEMDYAWIIGDIHRNPELIPK